jgi:acetylglutamate kinase
VVKETTLIKLGGRALEDPQALDQFAREVAAHPGRVVIVHGGGSEVSAWSEKLGLAPRFVGGRRVTDPATLEVAVAVLAGLANKRLVARLLAHGVRALGLSAMDGGLTRVEPHPEADQLGAVGRVTAFDQVGLNALLAQGFTPVIASIGAWQGGLLNVNADDLASVIAGGIGPECFVLLSDVDGLVLGGEVVHDMSMAEVVRALESPDVTGGMRPKLESALGAMTSRTQKVWIGKWNGPGTLAQAVLGKGPGTHIHPGAGTLTTQAETAHD